MTTFARTELFTTPDIKPLIRLGQMVRVVYTSPPYKLRPSYSRVMHYLGSVADRPEDNNSQPVYTERPGGLQIFDVEQSGLYTIKTSVQTMIEREQLPCGTRQRIETDLSPADLIFDLSNNRYKMDMLNTDIPLPR